MKTITLDFSKPSLKRVIESTLFLETYTDIINFIIRTLAPATEEYSVDSITKILTDTDFNQKPRVPIVNQKPRIPIVKVITLLYKDSNGLDTSVSCLILNKNNQTEIEEEPAKKKNSTNFQLSQHQLHMQLAKIQLIREYCKRKVQGLSPTIQVYITDDDIKIRCRLKPENQTELPILKSTVPEITDLVLCQKMLDLKKNAEKRNIPFNMSFPHLKRIWSLKKCQITGVTFEFIKDKLDNPLWKTIDRWDNEQGYTDNNTVVCTKRINSAKGDLSLKELDQLFKFHKKRQKKK